MLTIINVSNLPTYASTLKYFITFHVILNHVSPIIKFADLHKACQTSKGGQMPSCPPLAAPLISSQVGPECSRSIKPSLADYTLIGIRVTIQQIIFHHYKLIRYIDIYVQFLKQFRKLERYSLF